LIRLNRFVLFGSMSLLVVLAWAYLVFLRAQMPVNSMDMSMPDMLPWITSDYILTFIMWVVMMVGMMTPSAAPMVILFNNLNQARFGWKQAFGRTALFLAGYLFIWSAFSILATLVQGALHNATLLNNDIATTSPILGGVVLIMAGIYQFTPLKNACLKRCRTPMGFLMTSWRDGPRGAIQMGISHGTYCLGCCALLMALLFIGGVMNLLWIAAIALYILIEKVTSIGQVLSRVIGVGLVGWGAWMIVSVLIMK
jgi:predicted metal-binding membrane protein